MPLCVGPGPIANPELPGMARHSVETLGAEADELERLGVKAVILFGIPDEKDEEGSGAWDDDGVVQRALRELQGRDLVLITDVCLCEYTSHGHCGVLDGEHVDNDATLELLARTARSHVEAGADVIAPSDMLEGRVGAISGGIPRRAPGSARVADCDQAGRRRLRDLVLDEGARHLALRTRSDLYRRALELIPGGVNSPVRAMRAVGLDEPFFVRRGEGAYIE